MAIAFVRKTEGNSTSSTLTLNIQVSSGSNRALVVGLAYKSNQAQTPTSIVFNGSENFSLVRAGADGGDAQCFLYVLTNPTEATADVVITMPGSVRMVGYVGYFTGVDQTNPFTANSGDAQGTDAAPTITITSAADEVCVDILSQVSAGPDGATESWTSLCNGAATGGGTDTRGAGQYATGASSRVMDYTMTSTDHWNICAGALQEAAAGTDYYDTPSDTQDISDAVEMDVGNVLSDTQDITDSAKTSVGSKLSDTQDITDSLSKVSEFKRSLADTQDISDGVSIAFGLKLSDTLDMSDDIENGVGLVLSDTQDITDGIANAVGIELDDTVDITDAFEKVSEFKRDLTDTHDIADSYADDWVPPVGWTGDINGVTDPSGVNGIAVADITNINGV